MIVLKSIYVILIYNLRLLLFCSLSLLVCFCIFLYFNAIIANIEKNKIHVHVLFFNKAVILVACEQQTH